MESKYWKNTLSFCGGPHLSGGQITPDYSGGDKMMETNRIQNPGREIIDFEVYHSKV